MANSKARNLADLLSTGNLTVPSSTSLALTTGDSGVTVVDTGTDGQVQINVDNVVAMKINEHSMEIPKGTTAERSTVASVGELRYNTDTGYFESYTSAGWGSIATPPSILGVTPDTFSGEAGTEFTITGSFFDAASTVKIVGSNGTEYTPATTTFINSGELRITTATDLLVDNEPYKVKVTNGAGLSVESVQTIDAGTVPAFITTAGVVHETATYDEVISGVFIQASDAETSIESYAVTSGALPTGLTLDSTTGEISGTADPQATTTYNFTVTATDTVGNTNSRDFSVRIVKGDIVLGDPPVFVYGDTPTALSATDPEGTIFTYSVTSGSLPAGLTLNSDGTFTGTAQAGSGSVQITVTGTFGSATYENITYNVVDIYDLASYSTATLLTTYTATSTGPTGTIQGYTIPETGVYAFEAVGATASNENEPARVVGIPAIRRGSFYLTAGTEVSIVVGQQGQLGDGRPGWGGGGGTFVYLDNNGSPEYLVVSGGCGAMHTSESNNAYCNANWATTTGDGHPSAGSTSYFATGGNGGGGAGGGGAGILGPGVNTSYTQADVVGKSYPTWTGGERGGGFGGGGGCTNTWGGGGGGYSGGYGGYGGAPYSGGGGGCWNASNLFNDSGNGLFRVATQTGLDGFTMAHGSCKIYRIT